MAPDGDVREFVLTFERGRWVATSGELTVDGANLTELEEALADVFRSQPELAERLPTRVQLRFDISSLPAWMRQYQSHYLNYSLYIAADGSAEVRR